MKFAPAAAAVVVTADFDGYPAGPAITDQYRDLGGAGVVLRESPGGPTGPPALVTDVGTSAHSGSNIAKIFDLRGEFP